MTVKGVGESHEAVKQTGSGFGVDPQAVPEGRPLSSGSPCPPDLSHMTLSWGGDFRAGFRQSYFLIVCYLQMFIFSANL